MKKAAAWTVLALAVAGFGVLVGKAFLLVLAAAAGFGAFVWALDTVTGRIE